MFIFSINPCTSITKLSKHYNEEYFPTRMHGLWWHDHIRMYQCSQGAHLYMNSIPYHRPGVNRGRMKSDYTHLWFSKATEPDTIIAIHRIYYTCTWLPRFIPIAGTLVEDYNSFLQELLYMTGYWTLRMISLSAIIVFARLFSLVNNNYLQWFSSNISLFKYISSIFKSSK